MEALMDAKPFSFAGPLLKNAKKQAIKVEFYVFILQVKEGDVDDRVKISPKNGSRLSAGASITQIR
jgi:hypothetical protein